MSMRSSWVVVLAVLVLTVASSCKSIPRQVVSPLHPQIGEMLAWLPLRSETLLVFQGPFTFSDIDPNDPRHSFLQRARGFSLGFLLQVEDGTLRRHLNDHPISAAIAGSHTFRAPTQLGLMPYHGCLIVQFAPDAEVPLRTAFQELLERTEWKFALEGHEVAAFREVMEMDTWTLFVAQPSDGTLLYATDRDYLHEVLERMDHLPTDRAFPEHLPEWGQVNSVAAFWAIRHYRQEVASNDPSSPLSELNPQVPQDMEAIGFTFWLAEDLMLTKVRYLSAAKDAAELLASTWSEPSLGLNSRIERVGANVVEVSTSLADEQTVITCLFVLFAYLGHGIYL